MLSRRQFLQATASAAVLPWLRKPEGSFDFVFFSDTHVGLKNNIPQNQEMFAEMAKSNYAFGINGGDVTEYGWVGEYDNYKQLLKTLPFRVRHIAGNHDVRWSPLGPRAYREGTSDPLYQSFDHKGVHFVLLDSTIPLSHYGHFESEMLRWMEADLAKVGRQVPVLLFTHHWVGRDKIMVDNEVAFKRIIEPYNVKMIFNAHGHSDLLWTWDGLVNTMNKGLYQFSYEKVEIDREKDEIILSRRTKEKPDFSLLRRVSLKADRTKAPIWSVPAVMGREITLPDSLRPAEYRWDDGQWLPLTGTVLATKGLITGHHRLTVRTNQKYIDAGYGRLANEGSASPIQERWFKKLPGGVMSHLKIVGDSLLVSCMDGSLLRLRKKDGTEVWSAKMDGYCHSSPVESEGRIIVGCSDGMVRCFDFLTGKELWKQHTEGPVYASAAVAKGIVGIASGDGTVRGLKLTDGTPVWKATLPKSNSAFIQSPATTDGEKFFMGAWDSHLYAFDVLTGDLAFRDPCCADRSFAFSPAIGGPVIVNDLVVVPANGNVLYAFNRKTGMLAWQTTSPGDKFGYSSPTFDGTQIVCGCLGGMGEFRAVDPKTGQILWTAATGADIYDSSPCIGNGWSAVGSVNGLLSFAALKDGALLGQVQLPTGHVLASAVAENDHVYAASYGDFVAAFQVLKR